MTGISKLEALRKMMTPERAEEIRDLQEAVAEFSRDGNDENYGKVLLAFFTAAKDARLAFSPVESLDMEKKGVVPGKVMTSGGKCYVVCTSPEEAALCPEGIIVLVKLDKMAVNGAEDPSCNGICLNPYGGHPCLIPRDYIRRILGIG